MKVHFQHEVAALNEMVRTLAEKVLSQVKSAAECLTGKGVDAENVAKIDKEVDSLEVRIEEDCLKILALYAPVADELRYIFGITKVNHELERIGDLAKKVVKNAALIGDKKIPVTGADFKEMAEKAVTACSRAIESFIAQSADEARAVWENDVEIDEMQTKLCDRLDEALERREIPAKTLLAARSAVSALERIGDHATRIAKIVLYMRHGEIVRHRPLRQKRIRVLFICVHNSCRSQIAEAWLKNLYGDKFEAESAGLEPGAINPLAIEVMKEVGINIENNKTKAVFDLVKEGRLYSYVITVCDEASAERCPIFAGLTRREHWSFPDPSKFEGTMEERLAQTRKVRDAIKEKIEEWVRSLKI